MKSRKYKIWWGCENSNGKWIHNICIISKPQLNKRQGTWTPIWVLQGHTGGLWSGLGPLWIGIDLHKGGFDRWVTGRWDLWTGVDDGRWEEATADADTETGCGCGWQIGKLDENLHFEMPCGRIWQVSNKRQTDHVEQKREFILNHSWGKCVNFQI